MNAQVRSQAGTTLIEILVVLAIIGLMMGGLFVSVGVMKRSRLKSAINQLASTIRGTHGKAITSNGYYRLALNLDKEQYQLEYSEKAPLLQKHQPEVDNQQAANQGDTTDDDDPTKVVPASFEIFQDSSMKPAQLPSGVEFKWVYTPRQQELKKSGKAYIYFFPNGHGEQAAICITQLGEKDSDFLLTVKPLSGRVIIEEGCRFTPPSPSS